MLSSGGVAWPIAIVRAGSVGVDCDRGTGCNETFGFGRDVDEPPASVMDRPREMRRSGGSVAQLTWGECIFSLLPVFRFDRFELDRSEELPDLPVELDADCLCERASEVDVEEKSRNEYMRFGRVGEGGAEDSPENC